MSRNSQKHFYEQIKLRNIRKWITIYLSSGITLLGAVHLFDLRFQLPDFVFNVILILLIFGLFTSITIAWYHGEKGPQKLTVKEIVIHTIIFLLAAAVIFKVVVLADRAEPVEITENSVAVLPFTNMSGSEEDEYFSDGVTDDILTQLSMISGLKVISRTSVMKYKNETKNIREIGKELGVEAILEGSVRRSGNQVRIVAQLIDAETDSHLWAETYDRELEDIFAIQSEISEKIAAALETKLLPLEKELIEENSTENLDAYTYYLKGRHYYYNYNEEENELAIELFKRALDLDSSYALAYAGLADAYNQKVIKYWQSPAWLDSALAYSKMALSINSNLAEGYKSLALTYDNLGEKELALTNYEKAIKLNPNFASAILNYGQLKNIKGNYDESLYWFQRAVAVEPDNIWANISIGNVYKILGCYDLSIEWSKKALALEPDNQFLTMLIAENYMYAGNYDQAKTFINKSIESNEEMFLPWFFKSQIETSLGKYKEAKVNLDSSMSKAGEYDPEYFYGFLFTKLNDKEEGLKIIEEERKEYMDFVKNEPGAATLQDYLALVEIYAMLNDKEKAFGAWQNAIEQGWIDIRRIELYPYLENLKDSEDYNRLIEKMKRKIENFKTSIKIKYPEYEVCE